MNSEQLASRDKKLREFQEVLGYTFHDRGLLDTALCHSSYSNENGFPNSNERLEFLGDAVLELTVSHLLFAFFQDSSEGDLTQKRSNLVCHESLFKLARYLKIDELILCGKSLKRSCPVSIYSDAFEAVIGALYIDGGYDEVMRVVKRHFAFLQYKDKLQLEFSLPQDPKSRLQILLQDQKKMPVYETISMDGPDHAPIFTVKVLVEDDEWMGSGSSKKAAEFSAAANALRDIFPKEAI